jgi:hypothetical protein
MAYDYEMATDGAVLTNTSQERNKMTQTRVKENCGRED